MDNLWKELKAGISANYQYQSIQQQADVAEEYTQMLSGKQAMKRAGILSENFWLKTFVTQVVWKNFWPLN